MQSCASRQGFSIRSREGDDGPRTPRISCGCGDDFLLGIDPLDPLCALSAADLKAVVSATLDGNLAEQVIANKLLASREPEVPSAATPNDPVVTQPDPHADFDVRMSRWLGGVALFFTAAWISFIVLTRTPIGAHIDDNSGRSPGGKVHDEIIGTSTQHDQFAAPVRHLILLALPFAASGALIFSRRMLKDGTSRPMFAPLWRQVGWWTLTIAVAGYLWFLFAEDLWLLLEKAGII